MVDLIVNADDFGLSEAVNLGIIDAFQNGVVRSTSLMMNGCALEDAICKSKENPALKIGVHLTLTSGKPLLKTGSSLVDANGNFKLTSRYSEQNVEVELSEIEKEWSAQIETFCTLFEQLPHHLDSHHHIHGWEKLIPVVQRLSDKYQLPFRNVGVIKHLPVQKRTDFFTDQFYGEGVNPGFFKSLPDLFKNFSLEVMCHPAYIDERLRQLSSYVEMREKELAILKELHLDGLHYQLKA
ncbi:chitin disaccharide deacetylase [Alkalihalobacillus sp. 1P02AB]|uniref:chitin disaccharide deacetylase n=1 Tax=Alkalihalobacillus sp. 1P02AB TaxID=3132260 RepID=UPI0039A4CB32